MDYQKEINKIYHLQQLAKNFDKYKDYNFKKNNGEADYKKQYKVMVKLNEEADDLLKGYKFDPETNKMVRDSSVSLSNEDMKRNMETWYSINGDFFSAFKDYDEWFKLLVENKGPTVGSQRWSDYYRAYATADCFSKNYLLNEREEEYREIIERKNSMTQKFSDRELRWNKLQERAKEYNLDINNISEYIIKTKKNQKNLDAIIKEKEEQLKIQNEEKSKIDDETEILSHISWCYKSGVFNQENKEKLEKLKAELEAIEPKTQQEAEQQQKDFEMLKSIDDNEREIVRTSNYLNNRCKMQGIPTNLVEKAERLSIYRGKLQQFGEMENNTELVESYLEDGQLKDYYGEDFLKDMAKDIDISEADIKKMTGKELYEKLKQARRDILEKEIEPITENNDDLHYAYIRFIEGTYEKANAYAGLKKTQAYIDAAKNSGEAYKIIKKSNEILNNNIKVKYGVKDRIAMVKFGLTADKETFNKYKDGKTNTYKEKEAARLKLSKEIKELKEQRELGKKLGDIEKLNKEVIEFAKEEKDIGSGIKDLSTRRTLPKIFQSSLYQAEMLFKNMDFNKGSHKNSKEYDAMSEALRIVKDWGTGNMKKEVKAPGSTLPKSFDEALDRLGNAAKNYIDAKNSQIRPIASSLRTSRLDLANSLVLFADITKENCVKEKELRELEKEALHAKVEYKPKLTEEEIDDIIKADEKREKMENKNEEIDNEL